MLTDHFETKPEAAWRALSEAVERERLYSNGRRLKCHMEVVFQDVSLEHKRLLDVGGGKGLHSLYAAARGASEVVCLEPEGAGSHRGQMCADFHRLASGLSFVKHVSLRPVTFQEFDAPSGHFDVVLLHDSINHLDEEACVKLKLDQAAQDVYRALFRKLAGLMSAGGTLIVADCSPHNFFRLLGLRNPFAPQMEWEKHQSPAVWAALLSRFGFQEPKVRWTGFNRFGGLGNSLVSNRVAAYFLVSHFIMTMQLAR